jgi:uroporphyrin-III C-methyltransferase
MTVYLTGAGPGPVDLLTLRAADVLKRAEAVFHDRLANADILELVAKGAQLVDVGKRPGEPQPQQQINEMLIDAGRRFDCVVRLKGGDPFVFGRGGEEALALRQAGIRYEIIPGITSAIAVPAYAGIPVTHRNTARHFTVVTGHNMQAGDDVDWAALAQAGGTIVILMGVSQRARIAAALVDGGMATDTPVASVQWGTRVEQKTVRTTLSSLGAVDIAPPAVIVVGNVAALDLEWFDPASTGTTPQS